ncbi:MAG: hypothetical protein ACK4RG_05765 [Fimbriimonadales bacterium]
MRRLKIVGALVCLAAALSLSGCGDQGWVRVSPDGKYATVVIPQEISDEEKYAELSLYDLDRNTITPIARFALETQAPSTIPFLWIANCQWMPDSRALSFIAIEVPPSEPTPTTDSIDEKDCGTEEASYRVILYELGSGMLKRLPIEEPAAAQWSRDGKYLIVYHENNDTIAVYRAETWVRVAALEVPDDYYDNIISWEWAAMLAETPMSMLVLLGGTARQVSSKTTDDSCWYSDTVRVGNLYLVRGGQMVPFTTTQDVLAFWVDATQTVVRWARVKHENYIAVFERSVYGGAPKRLALLPHAEVPVNAEDDETYFRFSPNGDKLAWYDSEGLYVLDIPSGVVHRLTAASARNARGGVLQQFEDDSPVGFDWRGNETLVIQRGLDLETLSVRSLKRF